MNEIKQMINNTNLLGKPCKGETNNVINIKKVIIIIQNRT